jgi:hypothetical protein
MSKTKIPHIYSLRTKSGIKAELDTVRTMRQAICMFEEVEPEKAVLYPTSYCSCIGNAEVWKRRGGMCSESKLCLDMSTPNAHNRLETGRTFRCVGRVEKKKCGPH